MGRVWKKGAGLKAARVKRLPLTHRMGATKFNTYQSGGGSGVVIVKSPYTHT
jgi:hypothetical protein